VAAIQHDLGVARFDDDAHLRTGRVRLISRSGYDWASRFPADRFGCAEAAPKAFLAEGEVVVLDTDGVSGFDALDSHKYDKRAQFDMLAGDGEDFRPLALVLRKAKLARLLSREVDGIFIAEYEQGDIGDILFRVACNMGLEDPMGRAVRVWHSRRCQHTSGAPHVASI
jgi:bifunctional non-homologous end joining protein LigD